MFTAGQLVTWTTCLGQRIHAEVAVVGNAYGHDVYALWITGPGSRYVPGDLVAGVPPHELAPRDLEEPVQPS